MSAHATRVRGVSIALYRRYRPETFADVIGQEHVTEPLMQALRTGRVNHAYLFSGPRGCGKTTSARILARCLNCEQGPTPQPCGTCESCVALARGGAGTVDVIEIDAASHGGVDDARDLRERASYGPAQSRYKIYIIDEAHMVTPQGFNALLKIVEEPPEHVKFVFATTEPEKVIGTIRSRTHHYPFRLVPPARLQSYMEDLCAREGVAVAPGVLSFVVRAGGGSVRDSLSVLDQLIAGSGVEGLTYESAAALLGFTDGELLDATIDAMAAADGGGVFTAIDKVIETGLDPRRFVEDLLERLRDLVIVAAVPGGAGAVLRHLPPDQFERMRTQAAAFGSAALSRAADIANAGLTEMSGATSPRLQLELIAARILLPGAVGESGYAARLDRIERRLAAGGPIPAPAPPAPAVAPPAPAAVRPVQVTPAVTPQIPAVPEHEEPVEVGLPPAAPAAPAAPVAPAPGTAPAPIQTSKPAEAPAPVEPVVSSAPGALDTAALRRHWPDILARVFERRRVTWTFLSEHAQILDFNGERVLIGIATSGLAETFRRGQHGEYVRQALIDALGLDARVEAVSTEDPASAPRRRPEASAPAWGSEPAWGSPTPTPVQAQPPTPPTPPTVSTTAPAVGSAAPTPGRSFVDEPGSWGANPPPAQSAPAWASAPLPSSRTDAAADPTPEPEPHVIDDSAVSEDDESIDELADAGVPVVERLLGGTVLSEETS